MGKVDAEAVRDDTMREIVFTESLNRQEVCRMVEGGIEGAPLDEKQIRRVSAASGTKCAYFACDLIGGLNKWALKKKKMKIWCRFNGQHKTKQILFILYATPLCVHSIAPVFTAPLHCRFSVLAQLPIPTFHSCTPYSSPFLFTIIVSSHLTQYYTISSLTYSSTLKVDKSVIKEVCCKHKQNR